jgi:hypothetical protein
MAVTGDTGFRQGRQRDHRISARYPSFKKEGGVSRRRISSRLCRKRIAISINLIRLRAAGIRSPARALHKGVPGFVCAVRRDPADPRKPVGYSPLDAFWRKRGYTPYPDLVCRLEWREVGAVEATPHELSFWLKPLSGAELP